MSEYLTDILEDLGRFSRDPLGFVLWAFPWGEPGPLERRSGPEQWQREALLAIGNGVNPDDALRMATKSGNGVGKTTFVSWITLWAHSTFPETLGIITANTDTQLKTKVWPEIGKWFQMFIAKEMFELTATAIFSKEPSKKLTWRTDAIPWSENNPAAFQGLHNLDKRQFIIMDEASGIPEVIWNAAEGCMTDANTQRLFLVFGNPNYPEGRFKECFAGGKYSHMWRTTSVDSRNVSMSDKKWIDDMIQAEGLDSDFVRVRVLGEFPKHAVTAFISQFDVDEARSRELPDDWKALAFEPLVMGVDVARFGDDTTVFTFRRGRDARSIPSVVLRGADTVQVAARAKSLADEHKVEAVFVDGGGVGGGVVDNLRRLNAPVWDVQFGAKADLINLQDPYVKYANKRAEMWGALRSWLKGGCIPDDKDLADQLVGPNYSYQDKTQAILLERKQDMKGRGLPSPDKADSLALTFAFPITARAVVLDNPMDSLVVSEYDPLDDKYIKEYA